MDERAQPQGPIDENPVILYNEWIHTHFTQKSDQNQNHRQDGTLTHPRNPSQTIQSEICCEIEFLFDLMYSVPSCIVTNPAVQYTHTRVGRPDSSSSSSSHQ
jgi:hypothetical protein